MTQQDSRAHYLSKPTPGHQASSRDKTGLKVYMDKADNESMKLLKSRSM